MDDDSFYLYGVGEKPDALTLGSLVLEKYWMPLIARHYRHEPLRGKALEEHTWSSKLDNVVLHGKTRFSPGVGVSGFDIVDLKLAWKKDQERYVTARSGQKITLKDPEAFLSTEVLSNPKARSDLKLWLSSAKSDFVMNMRWARRPKIWFLTGIYVLEGARTILRKTSSSAVEVGVSSAIVGALSGVPVGGSVSLGQGDTWELQMGMEEEHVWAAQYRMIDAKYIAVSSSSSSSRSSINGPDNDSLLLPTTMSLYKDILSSRNRRTTSQLVDRPVNVDVEIALQSPLAHRSSTTTFTAPPLKFSAPLSSSMPVADLRTGSDQITPEARSRIVGAITLQPSNGEEEDDDNEEEEESDEAFEEYEKVLEEAICIFEAAPPSRFVQ